MIDFKQKVYLALGFTSVALGVIGIVLPVVPTVPFAILAAFFFSKSSPRMHQWVLSLPKIGQSVRDWDESGVIKPKAKLLCVFGIALFLGSSIYFAPQPYLKISLVIIGLGVLTFVLSRPSARK